MRITWRICEALTRDCPQDDSAVRRRRTKGGTEEGFGPRAGHIRARGEPHIQSYQMWREQVADRPKHIRHVIRNGASLRATFLITGYYAKSFRINNLLLYYMRNVSIITLNYKIIILPSRCSFCHAAVLRDPVYSLDSVFQRNDKKNTLICHPDVLFVIHVSLLSFRRKPESSLVSLDPDFRRDDRKKKFGMIEKRLFCNLKYID